MEKKTIDTLRVMLCGEIEDIAKKGSLSHESLDILKDLVETEKNLAKIEKYGEEKEEKEEMKKMGMSMGMGMDGGYSQRKFYIDADYDPRQMMNSYARGGGSSRAMGGGSQAMGGGSYGYSMGDVYDGGSYARGGGSNAGGSYAGGGGSNAGGSYMYDPRMEQMQMPMPMYSMARGNSNARGYSRNGSKEEMISELQELMNETQDETVKKVITEALGKIK